MKKIIIIGGGIAGLSAGIYGRICGYDVTIYEKNAISGGECIGWTRNGYHIDNCIHWLTGSKKGTALRKVWETIGAITPDYDFPASECFYTSYFNHEKATLWRDLAKTEQELLSISPDDSEEIRKLMKHVRYAQSCVIPSDIPMDMMGLKDYVKMGKEMMDMPKVMKEYGKISLSDLSMRFKHPLLKKLISDGLPSGHTASSFIVSYATIADGNGDIPAGGSLAMSQRITDKFVKLGGKIEYHSPVISILCNKKTAYGIRLKNGSEIQADYIISAVDTNFLFKTLLNDRYTPKIWKKTYENPDRFRVTSRFHVAFSIDKNFYHERGTIHFDCSPLHIGNNLYNRVSIRSYEYETEFAPNGKTVLQADVEQSMDDYTYWSNLSKEAYKQEKKQISEAIKCRILEQYPDLCGHISFLDCWTPLTYTRYCNAYKGSYMSFITKKNEKSFRVKGVIRPIKNLYIASQWINAPGGLPIALTSGKFAIQRILKKERRPYRNINKVI